MGDGLDGAAPGDGCHDRRGDLGAACEVDRHRGRTRSRRHRDDRQLLQLLHDPLQRRGGGRARGDRAVVSRPGTPRRSGCRAHGSRGGARVREHLHDHHGHRVQHAAAPHRAAAGRRADPVVERGAAPHRAPLPAPGRLPRPAASRAALAESVGGGGLPHRVGGLHDAAGPSRGEPGQRRPVLVSVPVPEPEQPRRMAVGHPLRPRDRRGDRRRRGPRRGVGQAAGPGRPRSVDAGATASVRAPAGRD